MGRCCPLQNNKGGDGFLTRTRRRRNGSSSDGHSVRSIALRRVHTTTVLRVLVGAHIHTRGFQAFHRDDGASYDDCDSYGKKQ